jgi:HTH-type transcriptional regulator/antitoxin HipB
MKIRSRKQLIDALIRYRTNRKWSQSQLSEEAGVSQQAISRIENGKVDPTLTTLFKLVSALEMDLDVSDRTHG